MPSQIAGSRQDAPPSGPAAQSAVLFWSSFGVVLCLAALPGLWLDFFPFADAVNHTARYRILAEANSDAALGQFYQSLFRLNTNMGLEFLYVTLFAWLDPVAFLKLANVMIAASVIGGTMCLGHALHGNWRVTDLVSALFVFNYAYVFGFLNFCLGAGLALLSFAGWVVLRRRSAVQGALFAALASFALYIVHLFALGLFGLAVLCYEGWRLYRERPLTRRELIGSAWPVLVAFVPASLFAVYQLAPRLAHADAQYVALDGLRYGSLEDRLTAIIGPVLTYFDAWDIAVWLLLLAAGVWVFRSGRARVAPEMAWLLVALAVLMVVMPARLMDAWGAHFRPGIFFACVLLASLTFRPWSVRDLGWVTAGVVGLVALRVTGVVAVNGPVAADFRALNDIAAELPAGAKVIGVFAGEREGPRILAGDRRLVRFQYNHATTVTTLRGSAFTPSVFSRPDVHNLTVQPALRHLDSPYLHPQKRGDFCATAAGPPGPESFRPDRAYAYGWGEKFDYVLTIGGSDMAPCPEPELQQIARARVFGLYVIGGSAGTAGGGR